ncbi:two-component system response regulator [Arthrobacter pityocampae]|uniref:Two-component system response regulator n=1 Tax=Arthrobacter pityocampae TaxID=547334 RepID=A0A2S5IWS1_9MICC|nr:SpoIIE family protein phosphatase [Arthrobacter pityocampae]PPB49026.1 two-component system response regulator [Arthrobacter pityocampae]
MTVAPEIRRALVVEDDGDIRGLLVQILKREGFEVTEASTAREGLQKARAGADLITLDLNLPDGDGVEICREVRTFSDAYILMITARTDEIERLTGLETGADEYISKPFSPRELVARINSLFRRQSHRAAVDVANADERQRAAEVQQNLLPRQKLTLDGFDLAGRFRPSRSVGGDFYDWYPTPDGLHFTVADAMGKGMGAALVAATVRATMRSVASQPGLETAFATAARSTEADLDHTSSFVTLFHGRLDGASGVVGYVDAGHGLALHVAADGSVARLPSAGPPVGAWPDQTWRAASLRLAPGDSLAIVSDGLLDIYETVDRFTEAVADVVSTAASAEEACAVLLDLADVPEVADDVTVVILRHARG